MARVDALPVLQYKSNIVHSDSAFVIAQLCQNSTMCVFCVIMCANFVAMCVCIFCIYVCVFCICVCVCLGVIQMAHISQCSPAWSQHQQHFFCCHSIFELIFLQEPMHTSRLNCTDCSWRQLTLISRKTLSHAWTTWTTPKTPTDQTIYKDKCRIRIVYLVLLFHTDFTYKLSHIILQSFCSCIK